MRRTGLAGLVLVLAACGGGEPEQVEESTAGPDVFVAEAREMSFGDADLSRAEDSQLLKLGNLACTGLSDGTLTIGQVVEGYVTSDSAPTAAEAEAFTRAAVHNLCPEHADQLPN